MHRARAQQWHELHLYRGCFECEWQFDGFKPFIGGGSFDDSRKPNIGQCSQGRWSGTHYVDGTIVKWWISHYELHRDLDTGVEDLHVDNRIVLVHRQWPHQRLELHLHRGCYQREWILKPLECNRCRHPFNRSWEPKWCERCQRRHTSHGVMDSTIVKWRRSNHWLHRDVNTWVKDV